MRVLFFLKTKSSRNGENTLSFTDIGKSCHSHNFFMSQIGLLTLFAKIKFARKFPNLQYIGPKNVCVSDYTLMHVLTFFLSFELWAVGILKLFLNIYRNSINTSFLEVYHIYILN